MPPGIKAAILAEVAVNPGDYAEKAKRYGVTKNAISGIVHRARGYKLKSRVRPTERKITAQPTGDWDARLFEPWHIRKARRAQEAQAR